MDPVEPRCLVSSVPGPAIYVHSPSSRDGRCAVTVQEPGAAVSVTIRLTPDNMRELARLIVEVLS